MNLQEEISKVAYELFETRGCVHGCDLADWFEAERIVLSQHAGQDFEEPEDVELSAEVAVLDEEYLELATSGRRGRA